MSGWSHRPTERGTVSNPLADDAVRSVASVLDSSRKIQDCKNMGIVCVTSFLPPKVEQTTYATRIYSNNMAPTTPRECYVIILFVVIVVMLVLVMLVFVVVLALILKSESRNKDPAGERWATAPA